MRVGWQKENRRRESAHTPLGELEQDIGMSAWGER